ncbi:hypothetical protein DFH11DRAFT_1568734 [Phellopilus nigrolimitatus]|nr:hypothetical protein DFH11DRAFT_1568734 [Phellopilus nigrolimitatus]
MDSLYPTGPCIPRSVTMITLPAIDGGYEKDSPIVEPLRKEHLDKAVDSVTTAFENDPMNKYVFGDAEKPSPTRSALTKRAWKVSFGRAIKRKLAYTVNGGDAVIVATPAEEDSTKPSLIDRAIDFVIKTILKTLQSQGPEQMKVYLTSQMSAVSVALILHQRFNEVQSKSQKLREEKLGDSVKSMIYLNLIATAPESQGHGYGTALMDTVLFQADIHRHSIYLFASNVANVAYYESFGFTTIALVTLGDDNPAWHDPPVLVPLMVREPKRLSTTQE